MKDLNDPTNRDSVPAMLTPGEFVLNKEASTMFGPAIEAMNNAGLQQRHGENLNMGGMAPPNPMGYNKGGKVDHEAFIKKITPHAKKVAAELGIDPRVIIAQAIQETGWGRKVKGNNYFGIKAHGSDDGKNVSFGTHEYDASGKKINIKDTFKGYDDIGDSVRGYGEFLKKNPRYKDFLAGGDLNTQLSNMGNSGYATDPNYGKNLGNIINGRTFKKFYDGDTPAATATTPEQNTQQPVQQQAVPQMQEAPPVPQQAAPPTQQRDEDMYYPVEEDFGGAFAAARKAHGGDGGQFTWKDKYYTTDVARNVGGPIGYNKGGRAGKKVKYWDSAQGTYVWGTKEQAAQAAAQSSLPQVEPTVTERNPMNFRKNAGVQAPPPPMQPMPGNPMQLGNILQSVGSDPVNTAPSRASHIGNRFNFGSQPPSPPPQIDSTPPVPGSDEALLQGGSQQVELQESASAAASLPIGHPDRMAAIENGTLTPTEGDLAHEDQQYQTNEALRRAQMLASVTAPDAPAAQGRQNRIEALNMQLSSLGTPEDQRGVGTNVQVGGPSEAPVLAGVPNQPFSPNQVGAVPGIDTTAPLPQDVIDNTPQGLFGNLTTPQPMAPPSMSDVPPSPVTRGGFNAPNRVNTSMLSAPANPGGLGGSNAPQQFDPSVLSAPANPGNRAGIQLPDVPEAVDPRQAAMQQGAGYGAGPLDVQAIAQLPIGHPQRMAAIESGVFIPTEGDLNHEDQRYQTNQALHREQMLASVTAPDAPAAQGRQNRIEALTSQLDSLGMPTDQQGVGTNVQVGGVDAPPELAGIPNQPFLPNEVGAVPGLDTNAPLPQDVIDNNPQGLFGDMTEIMPYVPGGEADQGLQQASETDSPIVTKPGGALMNVDELGNQTPVVNTSPPIERKSAVQTKVAELGEPMADDEAAQAVSAGEAADPSMIDKAKGLISDNFGGLFDEKELKRAAVLFAGAMITGMSPQRALAYAGTNYINRIDAKEARQISAQAATSKAGSDAAAKAALQPTSNNKTFWKNGQKMEALEMKAKDGTSLWVDKTGTPINTFEWTEDGKGSKAWKTQLKGTTDNTTKQLKELKETFGQIDPDDKTAGYKTDILPQTSAGKIAEWADQNGVDPAQLSGLVESAYHNTLNGGTSGERTRSIIPALEQLVIKQKTGNDKVWNMPDGKPVSMRKLNVLNTAASNKLRMLGHKGDVDNLANIFYGEALADWNALGPEGQKEFNNKAGKGENGFYFFANQMLMDFNPGG